MTSSEPAAKRPRLTLLSREWCHLCGEMQEALASLQPAYVFDLDVFDVDADPLLADRYGEDVPVLLAGETELSRHRFDRVAVEAWLDSHGGTQAARG